MFLPLPTMTPFPAFSALHSLYTETAANLCLGYTQQMPNALLVYFALAACVLASQVCILSAKLNAPMSLPSISKNDSAFKYMNTQC